MSEGLDLLDPLSEFLQYFAMIGCDYFVHDEKFNLIKLHSRLHAASIFLKSDFFKKRSLFWSENFKNFVSGF